MLLEPCDPAIYPYSPVFLDCKGQYIKPGDWFHYGSSSPTEFALRLPSQQSKMVDRYTVKYTYPRLNGKKRKVGGKPRFCFSGKLKSANFTKGAVLAGNPASFPSAAVLFSVATMGSYSDVLIHSVVRDTMFEELTIASLATEMQKIEDDKRVWRSRLSCNHYGLPLYLGCDLTGFAEWLYDASIEQIEAEFLRSLEIYRAVCDELSNQMLELQVLHISGEHEELLRQNEFAARLVSNLNY